MKLCLVSYICSTSTMQLLCHEAGVSASSELHLLCYGYSMEPDHNTILSQTQQRSRKDDDVNHSLAISSSALVFDLHEEAFRVGNSVLRCPQAWGFLTSSDHM